MFDKSLKARLAIIFLNGRCRVTQGPVSADPGRDDDPAQLVPAQLVPVRRVPGPASPAAVRGPLRMSSLAGAEHAAGPATGSPARPMTNSPG